MIMRGSLRGRGTPLDFFLNKVKLLKKCNGPLKKLKYHLTLSWEKNLYPRMIACF